MSDGTGGDELEKVLMPLIELNKRHLAMVTAIRVLYGNWKDDQPESLFANGSMYVEQCFLRSKAFEETLGVYGCKREIFLQFAERMYNEHPRWKRRNSHHKGSVAEQVYGKYDAERWIVETPKSMLKGRQRVTKQ